MRLTKILFLSLIIFGGFGFIKPAQAAILYPQPQELSVKVNETFILSATLNSEGEIINAIEAELNYPTDLLEVVDVSGGGSFLTLWPEPPAVDSGSGKITFTGGVPGGSYVFDAQAINITFRALRTGVADLWFDDSSTQVLLNDGLGSPASLTLAIGQVTINHPAPLDITINSPTHPDQDVWYQNNDFIVTWTTRPDAFYSYQLSTNPNYEPDKIPELNVGSYMFEGLSDGVHYFILYERLPKEDWVLVGRRRAKIDKAAPLPFEVIATHEDNEFARQAVISFATTDVMSGIDRYDVMEGDKLYQNIISPYFLVDQTRSKKITVTAYDLAGNNASATLTALDEKAGQRTLTLLFWILVILAAILLVVYLLLRPTRRDQTNNN